VAARHPEILVGGLVATGLRSAAAALVDGIAPAGGDVRQALLDRGLSIETLAAEPVIADWRAAIAACGLKPSTYKSSPEQLARRTLKSGPVRTGLPLVDLYCDVATRHLAPLGAYDVTLLPAAEVELRLADPQADEFHPLGGKDGDMPLSRDVVVYGTGHTVICWAFNCRDSRDTCLNDDTDTGLFLGEAVTGRQHEPLRAALADLAARLDGAGATVGPIACADAASPTGEIASP
jgi:DNA/RNA-binding domain of Phe-tRNA-synthetase-like protein